MKCCRLFLKSHTKLPFNMKRAATSTTGKEKNAKVAKTESNKFDVFWKNHGEAVKGIKPLMCLDGSSITNSAKIASFDLDYTLVTTQRGKGFPTGPSDWNFLSGKIAPKLKSLNEEGYKVVIFSNQAGIEKKKTKTADIQTKFADIMNKLGFAFQVFVSTGENIYRKPYTGMWDFMVKNCNSGTKVDMNAAFYVGDAAGRPKGWALGRSKDFSCSDRKFAKNVGLKFYTPEEFFDGSKPYPKFDWGSVDPEEVLEEAGKDSGYESIVSENPEMVILVGVPASGKSTFARRYLEPKNYAIVSRDSLKTQEKCLKFTTEMLKSKKSVVIDNTNPSKDARKSFIGIAKQVGVPVRCFYFQTSIELARHMNMYRQLQTLGKVRRIPDVGYNVYKSKFQEPDKSEGFTEINKITFKPKFDNEKDEELFKQRT